VARGVVTSVLRLCLYAAGFAVAAIGLAIGFSVLTAGSASAASNSGGGGSSSASGLSSVVGSAVSTATQASSGASQGGSGPGSSAVGQTVSQATSAVSGAASAAREPRVRSSRRRAPPSRARDAPPSRGRPVRREDHGHRAAFEALPALRVPDFTDVFGQTFEQLPAKTLVDWAPLKSWPVWGRRLP